MSHLKIFSPQDAMADDGLVAAVRVSSRGLVGEDRRLFGKRAAASLLHEADQWLSKVAADEVLVHLLAVGAGERYGCFTAGTPMATSDGQYVPIESLEVEDYVLSADGHTCPVSHIFRRNVDQTVKIDVCGLATTLQCSVDHPFRVARKGQFTCDRDKHKRCLPPTQGQQNICKRPSATEHGCGTADYRSINWEWATAETLQEGDFLIWTAPDVLPVLDISVDEGYLLGAWLAEGSFIRNAGNKAVRAIALDIHAQESAFLSQLRRVTTVIGLTCRDFTYSYDENSRRVTVTGNPERFRQWYAAFGEHAVSKHIPPWVCCLPREVRLAIIAGYFDGDGSCVVDEKENRTTARTHGHALALGMQRLCWSVGYPAVCCPLSSVGWNLSIANSYLTDLEHFSWKICGRELKQTTKVHGFYHEGRMYLPIRGIVPAGPAEVFNIEVAGDHTYSGPNIDSHNCNRNGDWFGADDCRRCHGTFEKFARLYRDHQNRDPAKSYGRVVKSAFNEPMHRIELLVALNASPAAAKRNGGLLADRELEKLASGDAIPVSMACTLPFDRCSYCGNEAASPTEYCRSPSEGGKCRAGGLRTKMGSLIEVDGDVHHLHAINPNPRFVDISHVHRPADRIAYVTGRIEKQAAADNAPVVPIGVTVPYSVAIGDARNPRAQSLLKIAYALAELEVSPPRMSQVTAAGLAASQSCVTDVPDAGYKCGAVLRALADAGCCLPVADFLHVLGGQSREKAAAVAAAVQRALPGVYTRLLSQDMAARLQDTEYLADDVAPAAVQDWVVKHAAAWSLHPSQVQARGWLASIRRDDTRTATSGTTPAYDPAVVALAEEYAIYKLAALDAMKTVATDFELTSQLAVLQNYIG